MSQGIPRASTGRAMASMARLMSGAERVRVPLKARCSRKCDEPAISSGSSREPTPIHTAMLAECAAGIGSVTTRSPDARVVVTTLASSAAISGPGGWPEFTDVAGDVDREVRRVPRHPWPPAPGLRETRRPARR